MQSFQIGSDEAGQRLDKFLRRILPGAGNGFLYKMLRKKNIVLNHKKAEGKEILTAGDTVSLFFSEDTFQLLSGPGDREDVSSYLQAYRNIKGVEILFQDENVLIVNKPAGVLSQKAREDQSSLNEWMIGCLLEQKKLSPETFKGFHPSVLNRLDRNTSGLVLCGISLKGSQLFSRLIRERDIRKYYLTIVKGVLRQKAHITGFLKKDKKTNRVFIRKEEIPGASPIETAYTPLKDNGEFTLLEVELITGKSHQIRAHLASEGHPVLGDEKYGDSAFNQKYRAKLGVRGQLLHAYLLEFPEQPALLSLSGKSVFAPLPAKMREVLAYGNMEIQGLTGHHAGGAHQ